MATIGRSFSDPDKYEQNWFISLTMEEGYLYSYCWDRCDHAGVIEITYSLMSFHTKLNVCEELVKSMVKKVNKDKERIVIFGNKIWLCEYIRFNQQTDPTKGLRSNYSFHKHVFGRAITHGITDDIVKRDPLLFKDFDITLDNDPKLSKPSISLRSDLGKSTGKGGDKGTVKGGCNNQDKGNDEGETRLNSSKHNEYSSDYYLATELAEKLSICPNHELVKDIQNFAIYLKDDFNIFDPLQVIQKKLNELLDYHTQSELTFEILKEAVSHSIQSKS